MSESMKTCHNCGEPKEYSDNWIDITTTDEYDKDGYCSLSCQQEKLGLYE